MNTRGAWVQNPFGKLNSFFHPSSGFAVSVMYLRSTNEEWGVSHWLVELIPLGQRARVKIPVDGLDPMYLLSGNISIVETFSLLEPWMRKLELVTYIGKRIYFTIEILDSNPTGAHSLVKLPKACWWDLMKVERAVQTMVGLVWSFRSINYETDLRKVERIQVSTGMLNATHTRLLRFVETFVTTLMNEKNHDIWRFHSD